jgi:hypothetical protein
MSERLPFLFGLTILSLFHTACGEPELTPEPGSRQVRGSTAIAPVGPDSLHTQTFAVCEAREPDGSPSSLNFVLQL